MRQLGYWARTELVEPTVDRQLASRNPVRLYPFQDMVELMVVAELLDSGKSLQHIRRVLDHLRKRGYRAPLRELSFATQGKDIYFQHPDGSWEGDRRPDQVVIPEVIDLQHMRHRIEQAVRRGPDEAGRIDPRRGRMGSKPVVTTIHCPSGEHRQLDHDASVRSGLDGAANRSPSAGSL